MIRRVRNYFFNAFREIFVYHHSSLKFRAKIYALFIAGSSEPLSHYESTLEEIAFNIYQQGDRANALIITVKEYIKSVHTKKHLGEEPLLIEVIQELRMVPRYALKIEPDHLEQLRECTHDQDSKIYQDRLIDFLRQKRSDYEEIRR
ncbi:hypothetical protein [Sulfuricurvum sp.]|uniref:hypothetical protein n=1 Tax=Sulfuricurvum sp. TaxID=2025608 RepID=UPI0019CA6219|nr:hypothetical protein [Sulfuricurvum sp.]MBD3798475.1 hypothetical protein [Campylobacterota bacterium]MBD3806277.1 hypothetical protein [Sulfuricurvum sp.]